MSTTAIRVVPVVDGITEASSNSSGYCSSLCASARYVFVGKGDGKIDKYAISSQSQPVIIPTVEFAAQVNTGSRKPVSLVQSVGSVVVCASGETLYVCNVDFKQDPVVLCKGVTAFAIHEDSNKVHSDLASLHHPSLVVAVNRKRLVLFNWSEKESKYMQESHEIPVSAEVITKLVWFNDWIIGSTMKSYFSIAPRGEKQVRDLFPIDQHTAISLIKNSNEVLLTGHDGLGIFMNIHASPYDPPTPAPRNTVPISAYEEPFILSVGSYLVVILPTEGSVTVYSMTSSDLRKVQHINLPSSCLPPSFVDSFTCSALPLISGPVMYLLVPVSFDSQFKKLMEQQKFSEALDLINFEFVNPTSRQIAIQNYHKQLAWHEFNQLNFALAFLHFNLSGVETALSEIKNLLEFWNKGKAKLIQLIKTKKSKQADTATIESIVSIANSSFIQFLQSQRQFVIASAGSSATTSFSLLSEMELMIVQLLTEEATAEEDLNAFLSDPKLTLSSDSLRQVLKDSPAVAFLQEREGNVVGAVETVMSKPDMGLSLLALAHRNKDRIPDELKQKIIQRLFTDQKFIEGAFLSTQLFEVVDSLSENSAIAILNPLLNASFESPSFTAAFNCLKHLSSKRASALVVYAVRLARFQQTIELENLIKSGLPKALGCVELLLNELESVAQVSAIPESFTFSRMLLWGQKGKHRDALIVNPSLGQEYISAVVPENDTETMTSVYLVLVTILFEQNMYQKAVNLVSAKVALFQKMPSKLIAVLPTDLPMSQQLIHVLQTLNNAIIADSRNSVVKDNLGAHSFLKTFSEWTKLRQYPGVLVTHESVCGICNQTFAEKTTGLAILPNGTPIHATCMKAINVDSQPIIDP